MCFREEVWRRLSFFLWVVRRDSAVRREGQSVAFKRVTRVEGEPQVGSWRRRSSGLMKRGWDFAHLRGGEGGFGQGLGG